MPVVKKQVDLSSSAPFEAIPVGSVALSLIIVSVTVGVAYELRCGTSGDWIGPFVGIGDWPMTIEIGDGLPLSDRNRGIYIRPVTPTPGAVLVLNASFGDRDVRGALEGAGGAAVQS